jgi:hypothetical protein
MSQAIVGRLYKHYKDPVKQYEVLVDMAIRTNNLVPEVIYRQLYQTPKYPRGTIWARLKEEFEGKVTLKDEQGNEIGIVDRFTLLDPREPEVFS